MTEKEKRIKEAKRAYARAYREKNREKIRAYNRAWSAANRDKVVATRERFYERKAEELLKEVGENG